MMMMKMFVFLFTGILLHVAGTPVISFTDSGMMRDTSIQGSAVQEVLFATNEDCDLYINNEPRGSVLKKEHTFLKLPSGTYTYRAKSKTSSDEMQQSFQVKDNGQNEIFIDLLYFIDERKKERELLKQVNSTPKQPASTKSATAKESPKKEPNPDAEKIVINMLSANMVAIKGGAYTMGNNKAPAADEVEHPVSISNIQFGKYEVTQAQWEAVMGYNPSDNANCSSCPVENVSWEEVMKFIRKINVAGNKKFRLPTEAEWEYVAKLGGRDEIEKAGGQEEYIKKTAWYFANSDKQTHPVGQKQPTVAGVYDLFGNVSEWCSDWYGSYYYKEDDNQKNPEGPPLGKEKVVRGGSILDYTGDRFRPSLRDKKNPTLRSKNIGFRLVLENN